MRCLFIALIACLALTPSADAGCPGGQCPTGIGSAYRVEKVRSYSAAYVAPTAVYAAPQGYGYGYAGPVGGYAKAAAYGESAYVEKSRTVVRERRGLFGRRRGR